MARKPEKATIGVIFPSDPKNDKNTKREGIDQHLCSKWISPLKSEPS